MKRIILILINYSFIVQGSALWRMEKTSNLHFNCITSIGDIDDLIFGDLAFRTAMEFIPKY